MNLSDNEAFMASTPFYVRTDGLLFVVKDSSEKERPMTEAEHVMYKTSQFEIDTDPQTGQKQMRP